VYCFGNAVVLTTDAGWKFFGNLMDAGRLSICGEESFGTGSDHIREKDGLWAVVGMFRSLLRFTSNPALLAWLNILAAANQKSGKPGSIGLKEILNDHYKKYGRSFFSRYDYEEVDSAAANAMVAELNKHIETSSLSTKSFKSRSTGQEYSVSKTFNFDYTDPIDSSFSKNQGQVIQFSDGSRVVFRLSGTGSQGATVRMYVERYTKDAAEFGKKTSEGLQGLIEVALELSRLKEYLKRDEPTVITVGIFFLD
jgi:phosphoglucomutase